MWGNLKTSLRWWNSEVDRLKRTTKLVVLILDSQLDFHVVTLRYKHFQSNCAITRYDLIKTILFQRYPLLRLSNLPPKRSAYKLDVDGMHYTKNWIELMHNQIKCFTEKLKKTYDKGRKHILFSPTWEICPTQVGNVFEWHQAETAFEEHCGSEKDKWTTHL